LDLPDVVDLVEIADHRAPRADELPAVLLDDRLGLGHRVVEGTELSVLQLDLGVEVDGRHRQVPGSGCHLSGGGPGSADGTGSSSTPSAMRRSTSSASMPSNPVQISRVCSPGSGAGLLAGSGMRSERNGAFSILIGSRPGCSNVRKKSRAWS